MQAAVDRVQRRQADMRWTASGLISSWKREHCHDSVASKGLSGNNGASGCEAGRPRRRAAPGTEAPVFAKKGEGGIKTACGQPVHAGRARMPGVRADAGLGEQSGQAESAPSGGGKEFGQREPEARQGRRTVLRTSGSCARRARAIKSRDVWCAGWRGSAARGAQHAQPERRPQAA